MRKRKFVTRSYKTEKELYKEFSDLVIENDMTMSSGIRSLMRKAVRERTLW